MAYDQTNSTVFSWPKQCLRFMSVQRGQQLAHICYECTCMCVCVYGYLYQWIILYQLNGKAPVKPNKNRPKINNNKTTHFIEKLMQFGVGGNSHNYNNNKYKRNKSTHKCYCHCLWCAWALSATTDKYKYAKFTVDMHMYVHNAIILLIITIK